jgi:hypothetical protein
MIFETVTDLAILWLGAGKPGSGRTGQVGTRTEMQCREA